MGYTVNMVDDKSGIVNTEWHETEVRYGNNFVPMPVRDRVQVVVTPSGMSATFTEQCNWRRSAAGGNMTTIALGQTGADPYYASTAGWENCFESFREAIPELQQRYQDVLTALKAAIAEGNAVARPTPEQRPAPTTECQQCSAQCAPHREACNKGDVAACKKAGGCVCACKLSAGGCNENVETLQSCLQSTGWGQDQGAAASK